MELRYDTSPIGEGKNWVTSVGGLPLFIRAVAHALIRAGHSESDAIRLAVGVMYSWAAGKGNGYMHGKVTPKTQAKAAAAVAEWESKKAAAHANGGSKRAVAEFAPSGPGSTFTGNNPDASGAGLMLPVDDPKRPKPREAELVGPHRYIPNVRDVKHCSKCGKGPLAAVHKDWAKVKQATPKRTSVATVEALLGRPVESRHRGPDHVHVPTGHANTPARKRQALKAAHKEALAGYEDQFVGPMRALFAKQQTTTLSRLNGRRGKVMVRRATEQMLEARASSQLGPESGPPSEGVPVTTAAPTGPAVPTTFVDAAAVFDSAFWLDKTIETLAPGYDKVAAAATTNARTQLEGTVSEEVHSLSAAQVRAALMARSQTVAAQVTETTYKQIATALADGMEKGESIPMLADRVKGVFTEASDSRATMIARTESASASNTAQMAYAKALPQGIVAGKIWLSVDDHRRRPTHGPPPIGCDGQARPLDLPFNVGGVNMDRPGDPTGPPSETIGCRCTTILVPMSQAHLLTQPQPKDFTYNPNPEVAA